MVSGNAGGLRSDSPQPEAENSGRHHWGNLCQVFSARQQPPPRSFLLQEGCEPVVPTLMSFVLYCAANSENNAKLYQYRNLHTALFGIGYKFLHSKQMETIRCMQEHGVFTPMHDFEELRKAADKYTNQGICMGEGWMITAEMAVLVEHGIKNIICTQPFGCLPNHIVAKGMSCTIKQAYPEANIVAIDYDPGATKSQSGKPNQADACLGSRRKINVLSTKKKTDSGMLSVFSFLLHKIGKDSTLFTVFAIKICVPFPVLSNSMH